MKRRAGDPFERFSINEKGCWIWSGAKNQEGYGSISVNGKSVRAHRAFYNKFVGPIPDGMQVCHRCDVSGCVNPSHLFVGTNKDNADDRDMKGRNRPVYGERHSKSKLTERQVEEIKHLFFVDRVSYKRLGARFGVDWSSIRDIIKGKNWKHMKAGGTPQPTKEQQG